MDNMDIKGIAVLLDNLKNGPVSKIEKTWGSLSNNLRTIKGILENCGEDSSSSEVLIREIEQFKNETKGRICEIREALNEMEAIIEN